MEHTTPNQEGNDMRLSRKDYADVCDDADRIFGPEESHGSPAPSAPRVREERDMDYTLTTNYGTNFEVPEEYLTGMSLQDVGYCLECGGERLGTEPDARDYPCEECDSHAVYGAQELLLMGRIT